MFLVLLLDLFPAVFVKDMKVKIYKVTFSGWKLICLKQTSLPSLALVCLCGAGNGPTLLILRSVWNYVPAEVLQKQRNERCSSECRYWVLLVQVERYRFSFLAMVWELLHASVLCNIIKLWNTLLKIDMKTKSIHGSRKESTNSWGQGWWLLNTRYAEMCSWMRKSVIYWLLKAE